MTCPVSNDPITGCKNPPNCVQKQKNTEGKVCLFQQCPLSCDESKHLCSGKKDRHGCTGPDTCEFKELDTTGEFCHGTCPVQCKEEEIVCQGQNDIDKGCRSSDTCVSKAKDVNGNYCPDNSQSHGCPIICDTNTIPCTMEKTTLGCKGKVECIPISYENGLACSDTSLCPTICKDNEILCPVHGKDENGCKKPDVCVHQKRDVHGELCPVQCPVECNYDEVWCNGYYDPNGCMEADTCVKRKEKLWGDDKGSLCPGICPADKCKNGEVLCYSQCDPCDGCPTEELCVPKFQDINGEHCPDNSASHNCPKTCASETGYEFYQDSHVFALCPLHENSLGCKPKAECKRRQKDIFDRYCPADSVCPVQCLSNEIQCPNGVDSRGCKRQDVCYPRGEDKDGNLCTINCPSKCTASQISCPVGAMPNGCRNSNQCIDKESFGIGSNGLSCPVSCPPICDDGQALISNGLDSNGCKKPSTCAGY